MLYRKDPFIKNNHKTEHETEGIKKMLLLFVTYRAREVSE